MELSQGPETYQPSHVEDLAADEGLPQEAEGGRGHRIRGRKRSQEDRIAARRIIDCAQRLLLQLKWADGLQGEGAGGQAGRSGSMKAIKDFLGEDKLKMFLNYCLHYIADLDIPIKRGTFVEYRTGLINVSPIGRNCSQEERDEFEKYDHQHKVREAFIQSLTKRFPDYGLKYSIGGQISFDVFPIGWDKTYCLKFLTHYD